MNAPNSRRLKVVLGSAALGVMAACSSDLAGNGRHLVQLSVTSKAPVSASANLAADLTGQATGAVTITSVQLLLSKIELSRTGTDDCIGDINDDDDNRGPGNAEHDNSGPGNAGDDNDGRHNDDNDVCEEAFRGPRVIDLPADGSVVPVIQMLLASGDFRELEAKLRPAPDLLDGKSVRVVGTFTPEAGAAAVPFEFTSVMRAKLEMEFAPPLVVDGTTQNTTVAIDVLSWFCRSSGCFDPRDPANQVRIENNIRRSFHAFEDNDRHGDDDHRGHNGSDDGSGHS